MPTIVIPYNRFKVINVFIQSVCFSYSFVKGTSFMAFKISFDLSLLIGAFSL
jgi:hypothetical protein